MSAKVSSGVSGRGGPGDREVLHQREEFGRRLDRWHRKIDYFPPLVRTREFVAQRLPDSLTAEEAAAKAHLERHYFSAYFHERVGVTFVEWLNAQRLARALELLETHSLSVRDVAEASGFLTVRHLQRAFRRYLGSTPTQYRLTVRSRLSDDRGR